MVDLHKNQKNVLLDMANNFAKRLVLVHLLLNVNGEPRRIKIIILEKLIFYA